MAKYRKKPTIVEAITYEELAEIHRHDQELYPNKRSKNLFPYHGWSIKFDPRWSHYLIPRPNGDDDMIMSPEDMLVTAPGNEIYPCKKDIFEKTYEKVEKNG
jgi:hypothetical protein